MVYIKRPDNHLFAIKYNPQTGKAEHCEVKKNNDTIKLYDQAQRLAIRARDAKARGDLDRGADR